MAQTIVAAARVATVLATASTWTAARRRSDGRAFYFIPSATSDAVYMTDATACTCPAAQKYSGPCKHSQAVRQHLASKAQPAQQPAQQPARHSAVSLAPKCGASDCDDDAGRSGYCYFHKRTVAA